MRDGDIIDGKKIVLKVEEGADPQGVYCTTYQMRNFFQQMADGFFSNLDIMNYIQHYVASTAPKKGAKLLDVCCGRALMLPLLRYNNKEIGGYTGVDISSRNLAEAKKRMEGKDYPFPVNFVEHDVSTMAEALDAPFDYIIYTSAVEHMHKAVGAASLRQCFQVLRPGGTMFISCPNTPGNGYDTQYAAHVYEWGIDELRSELRAIGFDIQQEVGLVMSAKTMHEHFTSIETPAPLREFYEKCKAYLPTKFLSCFFSVPYPELSKEILLITTKPVGLGLRRTK